MKLRFIIGTAQAVLAAAPAVAGPDDAALARIVDEGLNRSQAMTTASELMDGIGPRLTNSPNFYKAEEWAKARMQAIHLANVHAESFPFGTGWSVGDYHAAMTAPRRLPLTAIPVAWSPSTNGVISAPIVVAPMSKAENFAAWRGKLAGKIVLVSLPGATAEPDKPFFRRLDDGEIAKLDSYSLPSYDPENFARQAERRVFTKQLSDFLKAEGAAAMVRIAYRDGMLVSGEGSGFVPSQAIALPFFEFAAEDYRRLVRLAQTGTAPTVELKADTTFDTARLTSDNIFGEIPGTDPKAGYVMAGAHFDSWIAGDGASDNGAGSVAVLEAARILSSLGIRPRRTIRFALWSGEEQGLIGSKAYIDSHLAHRPLPAGSDPADWTAWGNAWPIQPLAGYNQLKAYFNLDNGSGKIRGIYAEGNVAAAPLLRDWLGPFKSMGAGAVVMQKTGGTDHVFIQAVGIPGYQFVQDPLDYGSRVHHSNLDTVDHMRADDMRQAATVIAGMLWQAANSDKELPRGPVPTRPAPTDPFKVKDPNE
ncbi:M20/M25/M40 family metallo-hydrolase [Parablastomonas sp. CN1-191]|uniref:M20/M25/M40 family metallo-hydrolase n=1 Tax=Parablastomonas sp. CN1-191 TaxID=3400908 RepID=UPI003BF8B026